ncbi:MULTISPECIES: hypothetical protein [Leptospira]|uniref:Uncharacterized protein n=3 Tax=Leptospira weilii TaxID=28184 RepID=A0A828Z0X7_9LEPT|nr:MULTISPECIES: hypothetical protein [Leptospira]EMM72119.1 hypothetical protein LEP1GSC038_3769 [Leptospira weilii str. 2006001855]EKR63645.1 hypothetical protein LEP1GSC036_4218 [Leptospira weilii str. 2006001853]EMJ65318.1 hypothetical protein LEP1GSC051_4109 [Leptospira sp. P2653]EMN90020.1 hypothetical protein LEP1GSC108_4709 [Leptospira weilii str. UI 13098]MCL8266844.1 hypothetical protein [Leptospira weilii]
MKLNLYTILPRPTIAYHPETKSYRIQRYALILSQLSILPLSLVHPVQVLRSLMNGVIQSVLGRIFMFSFLLSVVLSSNLVAQEESQNVKEKMVCQKIELIVNGQSYDDGYKCITPGAICYLVEGLSLSCFANPSPDSNPNQPKTN